MEKRLLGNTGLLVSQIGFGVLPMGPAQLNLSIEEGATLIDYALEAGFNFFDTAQYYRTYPYLRRGLKGWESRGGHSATAAQPVICSKSLTTSYEEMMKAIDEARLALDRDVIDIFLMHEVRSGQLPQRARAWEALMEARARGWITAIGLSTHHVDVAAAASKISELDVIFPLLNIAGLGIRKGQHFATAGEMLAAIKDCRQTGKGVFTMKAFGGGSLTGSYQAALDFVLGQPDVQSIMVGFGRKSEIDDMISYLNRTMDKGYNPDTSHKHIHINQEDCEGCGACKAACPASAIFWNEAGLAEVEQSRCLTCGYCTPVCPVRSVLLY